MLPPAHRMTRSSDFGSVVRAGRRARTATLVLHHRAGLSPDGRAAAVGLVVNRAVGGSVVRNRVSRRLRAQLAARLDRLAPGSGVVVRALPRSSSASSAELGADLDRALTTLTTPARRS